MHCEDGAGQSDQPDEKAEQQDTKHQRQRQPDLARAVGLLRRNAGHDNRKEDHVVDAENDLERRQGQQSSPGFRARQERHHALSDLTSAPIPKLASIRRTLSCELRNYRSTSRR